VTTPELMEKISAAQKGVSELHRLTQQYLKKREEEIENYHLSRDYPLLTDEEEQLVNQAWEGEEGGLEGILSEGWNIEVRRRDILKLEGSEWLNDEVVNFYFKLLQERHEKFPEKFPVKCFFFSTFFYSQLREKGYDQARLGRWTRRDNVDIFQMDKIIIPVHLGAHWTLAAINMKMKRFEYYDSLRGSGAACFSVCVFFFSLY
jgi:Ulp1 family protease